MGMMVMESGYGSAIPAAVIVHLSKTGAAFKSGLLNVGDHILSMNGTNFVGMPRKACIEQIKVLKLYVMCYYVASIAHLLLDRTSKYSFNYQAKFYSIDIREFDRGCHSGFLMGFIK